MTRDSLACDHLIAGHRFAYATRQPPRATARAIFSARMRQAEFKPRTLPDWPLWVDSSAFAHRWRMTAFCAF